MVIVASVGGAVLAYGVSMNPSKRQWPCSGTILDENGTLAGFALHSLVPFTVTIPVTNREMSKAVESRDASLVFGKLPW